MFGYGSRSQVIIEGTPDCDLTQHCLRQETHCAAKNVRQELWKMLFAARQVYVVSFLTTAQEHLSRYDSTYSG